MWLWLSKLFRPKSRTRSCTTIVSEVEPKVRKVPKAAVVHRPRGVPREPRKRPPGKPQVKTHVKAAIPEALRQEVWIMFNGEDEFGSCYCCGGMLHRYNRAIVLKKHGLQQWHASHVVAEANGGELSVDNLRTCCRHCNLSMGNQNLYAYIRDKQLSGPGCRQVKGYMRRHQSQRKSRRTNNYGKTTR